MRLFVAIRPPRPVRERLLGLMGGVRGARWLGDEQIHLTLRFIGETDRRMAEDIHSALTAVHQPRFELRLDGLGAFDRRGDPVTLWAGVAPHAPLLALHKKIDLACVRAGAEPERRAFAPHITVARLGRGAGPPAAFLASGAAATGAPFEVAEFDLYESHLTPDGPDYTLLERYRLD